MIYAVIVLSLLLCVCAVAVLIDIVPMAKRWYERIGTGSLGSDENWRSAVKNIAQKWIVDMPSVKLSDNERLTVIDRVKGTYKSDRVQSWQEASLLLGLNSVGDEASSEAVKKFLDSKLNERGEWKNPVSAPDFAMLGYAVMESPLTDAEKIKPAMDSIYKFLLDSAKGGTVPYNKNIPDIRFVDTVGMVCPFLFKYAYIYNVYEAAELASKQISEYIANGMHSELFVPVHCYNSSNNVPLGIYGWGRGCGWLAEGLADSLKCAGSDYGEMLTDISKKFADSMIKTQLPCGAWSRQIFAEKQGESSATAMTGYFMSVMYDTFGDEKYKKSADSAKKFLVSITRKNGKVDYAQGDTKGIGFYSVSLGTMPAAQGFALRF